MKISYIFLIILITLSISGCEEKMLDEEAEEYSIEDYYSIVENSDNTYTIYLYDNDKNVVHEDITGKEPFIEALNDYILRVTLSVGSPMNYTYFYDITTYKISLVYENALLIEGDKIVYMDGDKLIISDVMNKDLYYKQIEREWTKTAAPSSAIVGVRFIEPNIIEVNYYTGDDYEEVLEVIDLRTI